MAVLWFVPPPLAQAVSPTPREMAEARRCSAAISDGTERFFSFAYDGNRPAWVEDERLVNGDGCVNPEEVSMRIDAVATQPVFGGVCHQLVGIAGRVKYRPKNGTAPHGWQGCAENSSAV